MMCEINTKRLKINPLDKLDSFRRSSQPVSVPLIFLLSLLRQCAHNSNILCSTIHRRYTRLNRSYEISRHSGLWVSCGFGIADFKFKSHLSVDLMTIKYWKPIYCRDKRNGIYYAAERFYRSVLFFFFNSPRENVQREWHEIAPTGCFGKMPSADVTMFGIQFTDKALKSPKKRKNKNKNQLRVSPRYPAAKKRKRQWAFCRRFAADDGWFRVSSLMQ